MPADPSLDQLIRPLQERRRDRQAEGFGGLEVDHEVELRGLLDWQVGRLGALQDFVYIDRSTLLHLGNIYSIGHEATWLNIHLERIDSGDPMLGSKIDDGPSMHEHKGRRPHQYGLVAILHHAEESGSDVRRSVHDVRMELNAEVPSRGRDLLIEPIEYLEERRGCDILAKERDL